MDLCFFCPFLFLIHGSGGKGKVFVFSLFGIIIYIKGLEYIELRKLKIILRNGLDIETRKWKLLLMKSGCKVGLIIKQVLKRFLYRTF